jgi:hypothetical protein
MADKYDGSIKIDTKLDSKGFNQGVKSISSGLGNILGMLSKIGLAIGLVFGIGQVVDFGKSAVQAASDLSSAMVGLQSIMDGQGRSFATAQKFIEDYTQDGLIPATNAINAYKNLALRGYDTSQIESVLIALKDSAAFGRQASYSLGEAVQTATEGLKNENSILVDNAGVTKNVAKMWKEYADSIGTTTDALTQQQKIQAEVAGILEESKYQAGDAAKVASTFAGVNMQLSASFYNFKVAIGNIFMPLLQRIIPMVTKVVDALTVFANKIAQIVNLLLGTNVSVASSQMGDLASNTGAAANAQDDLANATNKAGKAAKGALAAFDDLNVLQQDTGAGDPVSAGIGAGIGAGFGEVDTAINAFDEKLAAFVERIKAKFAELVAPLQEPFKKLQEALSNLGATAWENLKWAYENILEPLGLWLLQDAAPVFLDLLAAALEFLNEVLIAISPYLKRLWEDFLKPLAAWTADKVLDYLAWVAEGIREITRVLKEEGFGAAILASWNYTTSKMKEIAYQIYGAIIAKWLEFYTWFLQRVIDPVRSIFIRLWDSIKTLAFNAWAGVQNIWKIAGDWFRNSIIEPIKNGFKTGLDFIKTQWENTFTGIKNFVKNTVNSIIDFINGMIAAVAGGINAVISSLNKINVTVPSWVPGYGGRSWGLSIPSVSAPSIPRLATGAVIPPNSEFLAVLGDQKSGRNIETPEALLRQIVNEELGNIKAEIEINFTGTLAALVRELKPYIDNENIRVGGSLINGSVSI